MSLDLKIRHRIRGKYVKHVHNSEYFIVKLLKQKPHTLETISNYIKKDKRTTQQMITNMRKKGYYITLKGYGGFYELKTVWCEKCGFGSYTVRGLRRHDTMSHRIKNVMDQLV